MSHTIKNPDELGKRFISNYLQIGMTNKESAAVGYIIIITITYYE